MPADDATDRGLSRAGLVATALDLVQADGLAALTMRGLADRLGVKPASLYWHVRDRDELIELLGDALLAEVRVPRRSAGWRSDALAVCSGLERVVTRRRDAPRILLEAPDALERSEAHARLRASLEEGGLTVAEGQEVATMMLAEVLVGAARGPAPVATSERKASEVAIDTGSRGVTLRAGSGMTGLIRVARDPSAAAPAIVRGDTVIVRRRRGVGQAELDLNPDHQWRFHVQAPTWNTVLNLPGLDVREIKIDSGAVRVECILPPPRGVVPIDISSGVVGVRLRRPPGAKVVADVSTGAIQLRLDALSIAATTGDAHWESAGPSSGHHYLLRVNSGAVRVALEEDATITAPAVDARTSPAAAGGVIAALNLVLDGIAARRE